MITPAHRQIIGKAEMIGFPELNIENVPAKIDTGAYRCAVWASDISEIGNKISFKLFNRESPYYNGIEIVTKDYFKSRVRSSFGHREERYRVKLKIRVGSKVYKTDFTLANRAINRYPVLLGRSLLRDRFIVDVTEENVHFKSR